MQIINLRQQKILFILKRRRAFAKRIWGSASLVRMVDNATTLQSASMDVIWCVAGEDIGHKRWQWSRNAHAPSTGAAKSSVKRAGRRKQFTHAFEEFLEFKAEFLWPQKLNETERKNSITDHKILDG